MDNINPRLKNIAQKVLNRSNIPEDQKFGSVIAILMVISMILTFIRILQECNKNKTHGLSSKQKSVIYGEEIRSFSKKRGWFTRLRMKRALKKQLDSEDFNKYGIKLIESMLDVGETITDDEACTLVEEAHV